MKFESEIEFHSTTSTSQSAAMSHSHSESGAQDPIDSLIDFPDYDKLSYRSPSQSPSVSKAQFNATVASTTPAALPSSQPSLSGPSHNYDLYRQQTGIPPGAIASTLAVNQQQPFHFVHGYMSAVGTAEELINYPAVLGRHASFASDLDDPSFFYSEQPSSPEFVNPQALAGQQVSPPHTLRGQSTSHVGRLWPGMHQQQALAKAQAQQKQQQIMIQQLQQRNSNMAGHQRKPSQQRAKGARPPTDPIVEEKISQILSSMRRSSMGSEDNDHPGGDYISQAQRLRKDEDDMDEDERLLASEEGKKLSSKERRQLRNKVSARAFRSRRKEYISQLEGEITVKVNENGDLRAQNRALMEENTRLSDLTRMLLSSPSFSGFLDTLASNPVAPQNEHAIQQQQQQSQPHQIEQPQRSMPKDVNPYLAEQQLQDPQIGLTLVPDTPMDFSILDLNIDGGYSYQPQVFSVRAMPETIIDTKILAGKSYLLPLSSDDDKLLLPVFERAPELMEMETVEAPVNVDEEFDTDPTFALFIAQPNATPASSSLPELDLSFLSQLSLKPCNFEMVVVDEATADAAMRKVTRVVAEAESCFERLSLMTMHL